MNFTRENLEAYKADLENQIIAIRSKIEVINELLAFDEEHRDDPNTEANQLREALRALDDTTNAYILEQQARQTAQEELQQQRELYDSKIATLQNKIDQMTEIHDSARKQQKQPKE